MVTSYAFWQSCLAAKAASKPLPIATVEMPTPGFWRMKRNGGWLPVAVWPKKNGLQGADALGFKIGDKTVGSNMGVELWASFCANPVTEDTYRDVAEKGKNWPDADPVVEQIRATSPDSHDEFSEQISAAAAGISIYSKIESDEQSARAAGLRNMLLKLKKDADDARTALKAPHLKAGQEVDARWNPLVKQAQASADTIRNAMADWETTKRQAAAQAAQRDTDSANEAMVAGRPAPPPVQSNAPAPAVQVRPTYGKAAGVSTYQHVVKVDPDKFIAALRVRPEWFGLLSYLEGVAQKLAAGGTILDGVHTEERARIK